ncbi:putative ATP-grasp-modified RiPP [Streptomyces sp. NPDC059568]|uniref:putative ATP-grasp-modified RiPP n=1 Tax=Streptomyces sp. NPDC059568 TaxID=3346868 RepID=UPI003692F97C
MTTAISHPREAFPITPEAGRTPHSSEEPTGAGTRPWILQYVRVPDSQQATIVPETVYDEDRQMSFTLGGDLVTCMANTHSPTVPDGNMKNPPPLDEGTKD